MNFAFLNGSARQKQLWTEAAHHFLHLPFDLIPLTVEVSFEDPDKVGGLGHTEFALTTWTYGENSSTTVIRNDAPGFGELRKSMEAEAASLGLSFSTEQFYMETSAHELGHSLFASLEEGQRVAIAQMFGASSDDPDELAPKGSDWRDRIIEAIAETFKEAFLPRRFRVFPNRTRLKLPYNRFPEFRSHFRRMHEAGGTEEVGEEGSGWFRTPRVDSYAYGVEVDPVILPAEPAEKGKHPSGLYDSLFYSTTSMSPPQWHYKGWSEARWKAVLTDAVEARVPILVPGQAEFFDLEPEDDYSYIGDMTGFIFNVAPFVRYLAHAEIEVVADDNGDRWTLHWFIGMNFGRRFDVPSTKIKGYTTESIKEWMKNGVVIHSEEIPGINFDFSFTEHGMSGLEILQAMEAIGESPAYDVKKVPYEMRTRENSVVYDFAIFGEVGKKLPTSLRDFVWNRMQSLWVCTLDTVPGEGEGKTIEVEAPGGSLAPGDFQSGVVPKRNPVVA